MFYRTIHKFIFQSVFILFASTLLAAGQNITLRSEIKDFGEQELAYLDQLLDDVAQEYKIDLLIYGSSSLTEIYRLDKEGEVVVEQRAPVVKFMVTLKKKGRNPEVQFFESSGNSKSELMENCAKTVKEWLLTR